MRGLHRDPSACESTLAVTTLTPNLIPENQALEDV